jgi:hypothetical protein
VEVLASALKHGVLVEDIEHAVNNAMAIDNLDDDLRLYLGPDRSAALLEVITLVRDDDQPELGDPRHVDAREVPTTVAGR